MPFGLQPRGLLVHRTADFVQDVLKLGRLREGTLALVAGGVPGQLVSGHVNHSLIAVH